MNDMTPQTEKGSSTGLDQNVAGLLCYLAGFITGIIFIVLEKKSRFVRFHAMQSIVLSAAIVIINFVAGLIPFLGFVLQLIIELLGFILWIVMMVKAYNKEMYKLPIIGDLSENYIK